MNKLSLAKMGAKNPAWKGDKVGYAGVHDYVRNRIRKPKWCVWCKKRPAVDLANKTGKYLRDLNDWEYLCRKCHMDSDGRNDRLRASGKSRKLPNKFCEVCKKEFHIDNRDAKFCSRKCYFISRTGVSRPFYNNQYTKI